MFSFRFINRESHGFFDDNRFFIGLSDETRTGFVGSPTGHRDVRKEDEAEFSFLNLMYSHWTENTDRSSRCEKGGRGLIKIF